MHILRNLPTDDPKALADMIAVRPGRVVSMALSRSDHFLMTLFAFDAGESVRDAQYFGDTLYWVLEGEMPVDMGTQQVCLRTGQVLMIPAGTVHAIGGAGAFKLVQITLQ